MTNIASTIIEKCGGVARTAKLCGKNESWVRKWTYPKGKSGGRGGVIPHEDCEKLLMAAKRGEVALTPADFFATTLDPS